MAALAHHDAQPAPVDAGSRAPPQPGGVRFTELSPTSAGHIPEALADYVLDGRPARVGIESTVLSLVDLPLLLRPGVIQLQEIEGTDRSGVGRGAGARPACLSGNAPAPLSAGDAFVPAEAR